MEDPIVGRVLEGRYRVVGHLARGGMSTVYHAVDERLDRKVAVKVMSAALSTDPAFADRFTREARVAARLSHPNVVSVYDQGTDDGHVFLVMELVRGRTLRDLLRERGALNPALAVSIMEPVLGALAAAHRAGLVHRDVKPENILLADDGAVKVADFGLARAIESDGSSTRTGLMMGTVAYCPPEQISRGSADARSDVYSAGVVLFELLTGAAPYSGDSAMAVAYQHVNSDVPAPSSRRPGIPVALDEVVQRATRREPSGRPLDAGALLAELHDVRLDLELPVVPVPSRPRADEDPHATQVIAAHRESASRQGSEVTAPAYGPQRADDRRHTTVERRPPMPPMAPVGRPERSPSAQRRRRARRRTLIAIILIVLLGLLTGYGAWWLTVGRYRQVPDVSGLGQSAATQRLVADGFLVNPSVETAFSETVQNGRIIGTVPHARQHLIRGRMVMLILSRGQERFTLPSVAGAAYSAAQQQLAPLPVQLVRSDASDDSGKIAKGDVLRTDPPAGSRVRRNQVVTVYVSTGPPIVQVPGVINDPQNQAGSVLSAAGFQVSFAQGYSDTVPAGRVISQSPAPQTSVAKFSTVTATISQGPPLVTVPNISNGTDADVAKAELRALGLKVKVNTDFGGFLNRVVAMDPKAGTQLPKGSTVTLTVV